MSTVENPSTPREVTIIAADDARRALLRASLEAQGWKVRAESNGRRVLRGWSRELATPFLFIDLDENDLDAFELLAGVAAHRIAPRVLAAARAELADALRPLGVEAVVAPHGRFAEIAQALEGLRVGAIIRAA